MNATPAQQADYDVAIVGAGFAGLYALYRCRQLGLTARVWEAGEGVGGTWYWNRYPGARCDIESMQYSYQFDEALAQDWNWTERYAAQPEILSYAEHVADRFDLLKDITFQRRVVRAEFREEGSNWVLTAENGDTLTARFCIMATGCLSVPNWPDIAGYDRFKGALLHTAQWPHEPVDFTDKRVAVIGTGSSAIQSIPIIAKEAAQVTVFQRTPNYTVPAQNRPLTKDEIAATKAEYPALRARARKFANGIDGRFPAGNAVDATAADRGETYQEAWQDGGLPFLRTYRDILTDAAANATMAEFVRAKVRDAVQDPKTAETLCSTNVIGAKRLCVDIGYYETYNRANVTLVDLNRSPLEEITSDGVRTSEQEYDADIIVMAVGFDAMTGALQRMNIQGRNGRELNAYWAEGPRNYLGLAISGFPNLFTVTGPGSPSVLTNMLPTIEQHVEWITDCILHAKTKGAAAVEATQEAEADWWEHVQQVGASGLLSQGNSWYLGANIPGKPRAYMPYGGGFPAYCRKCEEVTASGYEGFSIG